MGLSLPQFWIALVLILIFSERLRWLPASGLRPIGSSSNDVLVMAPYLIMPTVVMSLGILPSIVRYTRSSLIDVLSQDYIRTAHSKGMRERGVIYVHALRNALIPVVTLIGSLLPILLGGAVLVESIFGLPGLGRLAIRAAQNRDFPVVLTLNMLSAVIVLASNLITDMIYTFLDPRISLDK
jgi:peptide/nickel transport system permease protein